MIRQATLPLLFVLSPGFRSDPAEALERRLHRAALRREPVVLGTAAAPYEPAGRGESPLRRLLTLGDGLEISITTDSPRILRELELLAELDRRHSVTVRMLIPVGTPDPGWRLRVAHGLASEEITTVLLLTPATPAGAESPRIEEELRFLLEEARKAEVHDVEILAGSLRRPERRAERTALQATFGRLRLEHGFPRRFAGFAGRG
jgi:DNA repair photolyase